MHPTKPRDFRVWLSNGEHALTTIIQAPSARAALALAEAEHPDYDVTDIQTIREEATEFVVSFANGGSVIVEAASSAEAQTKAAADDNYKRRITNVEVL